MSKKGQGMIIAWVLLIGLTVALAVIVTTWTRQQAEETTEGIVAGTEVELRCAAVSFNAKPTCNGNHIDVVNRGDFSIRKFVIHMNNKDGLNSETVEFFEDPILPGKSKGINTKEIDSLYGTISLTPFILVDNQIVGCSDRKLTLECKAGN